MEAVRRPLEEAGGTVPGSHERLCRFRVMEPEGEQGMRGETTRAQPQTIKEGGSGSIVQARACHSSHEECCDGRCNEGVGQKAY